MNLQEFKDALSREATGLSKAEAVKQGICIRCKMPPVFLTDAGIREYPISGYGEPCFDEVTNPVLSCCHKHMDRCECDSPGQPVNRGVDCQHPTGTEPAL